MQNSRYQISRYCIALIFLVCGFSISQAQTDFSIDNIRKLGLPVVSITTVNNEEPTCEYVTHPEGSFGEGIANATKVPCRIVILNGDNTLYDSGDYEKDISGATIKINGNTSAYSDNKPYKIKLQKKEDLLLRGDSKFKDKEWRLLKDARTLKTIIGLKMNELIGLPWTPAYQPCNVFINNDYRGCYLLIESVKKNTDCRLNVNKTGFIVERDPYWWNENTYFTTNFFSSHNYYRWTWKYPDEDDVTEEQVTSITNYINEVEKSINEGNYEQYLDVNSFASWVLAHDMLGTWDSGGSNLYVMRYDNSPASLLQMANMWDFDTILKLQKGSFSRIHTNSTDFYFPALFNNQNKSFVQAYKQKWEAVKNTIPQQIIDYVKTFANSEEGKALQTSREYYTQRWNYDLETIDENVEEMVQWFEEHIPLLDAAINNIDDGTDIIVPINNNYTKTIIYNLQGEKVNFPNKGIYIINGKKYILN